MYLTLHPIEFIFINLSALLEHIAMLQLVWHSKYAHSSFSYFVQSLLPKDNL